MLFLSLVSFNKIENNTINENPVVQNETQDKSEFKAKNTHVLMQVGDVLDVANIEIENPNNAKYTIKFEDGSHQKTFSIPGRYFVRIVVTTEDGKDIGTVLTVEVSPK